MARTLKKIAVRKLLPSLLALIALSYPSNVLAWGEVGHVISAEYGTLLATPGAMKNCRISPAQIIKHINDPDQAWRGQRWAHPQEPRAHYFHVDRQPPDWRSRAKAKDLEDGTLVYRIVDWFDEARKLREKKNWEELSIRLWGLAHYLGDLAQPLHLHHDHDGKEAGMAGLHTQFESRLIKRYSDEIRAGLRQRIRTETIPATWKSIEFRNLVFDTAQQSAAKVPDFLAKAKLAQKPAKKAKKSKREIPAQFTKATLWTHTGEFATDQLTLAARLIGHMLNLVCQ